MGETIRGGVIGYGGAFGMGRQHANHMTGAGFQFVAACDTDEARLKAAEEENPGIKTFLDYRDMLADPDVDLVVVILPHNLHAPVSIAASEAGKHVIVEKPMCITKQEAQEMIAASEKAGKMLSVYQNRRWDGDYLTIKELVEKGTIGDVVSIEFNIGGYREPRDWWRSKKDVAGGVLHDWGAHMIDWAVNIIKSEVTGVFGFLYNGVWEASTIDDHGKAVIRFASGSIAEVTVSSVTTLPLPKWRVIGTRGGLSCDWGKPVTVNVDHSGHIATFEVHHPQDAWHCYYHAIADHLYRGAELAVKPQDSAKVISIIEAAERSAVSGQVEIP